MSASCIRTCRSLRQKPTSRLLRQRSDGEARPPPGLFILGEDLTRTAQGIARQREAGLRTHRANFEKRLIPAFKIKPLVQELVDRYGSERAAASATGLSRNMIRCALYGKNCEGGTTRDFVNRSTAKAIILALYEKRREDSRNHKTSERFHAARKAQAREEARRLSLMGY